MVPTVDIFELYTLRGIVAHPSACEAARRAGPGIFRPGDARILFCALLTGRWENVEAVIGKGDTERTSMGELIGQVLRRTCPDVSGGVTGEKWALDLIEKLDRARRVCEAARPDRIAELFRGCESMRRMGRPRSEIKKRLAEIEALWDQEEQEARTARTETAA